MAKAFRGLWAQIKTGVVFASVFWFVAPAFLVWGAPMIPGLLPAVPFASIATGPDAGRAFARVGISTTAEERTPPLELPWICYVPGVFDPCPASTMLGEVSRPLASGELGS